MVFTGGASDKESACQLRRCRRCRFDYLVSKSHWSKKWQPTPVLLPGQVHGQSSLVGYCPLGCKESDTTEWAHTHTHTHTHMHSLIYIKIICKLQTKNHFLHNCKLNYHYTYLKLYMHTCISISIYLSIYITVIYCVHYSSFINWPLKYSIVGTRIQIL